MNWTNLIVRMAWVSHAPHDPPAIDKRQRRRNSWTWTQHQITINLQQKIISHRLIYCCFFISGNVHFDAKLERIGKENEKRQKRCIDDVILYIIEWKISRRVLWFFLSLWPPNTTCVCVCECFLVCRKRFRSDWTTVAKKINHEIDTLRCPTSSLTAWITFDRCVRIDRVRNVSIYVAKVFRSCRSIRWTICMCRTKNAHSFELVLHFERTENPFPRIDVSEHTKMPKWTEAHKTINGELHETSQSANFSI